MNNTSPRDYKITFVDGVEIFVVSYDINDAIIQSCIDYTGGVKEGESAPDIKKIEAARPPRDNMFKVVSDVFNGLVSSAKNAKT